MLADFSDQERRVPVAFAASDAGNEVLEDRLARGCVGHFGVELHAEDPFVGRGHGGDSTARGLPADGLKAVGERGDRVAMARPDSLFFIEASEKRRRWIKRGERVTKLAVGFDVLDGAAEEVCVPLHAEADPEDGDVALGEETHHLLRRLRRIHVGYRMGTAGENDALDLVIRSPPLGLLRVEDGSTVPELAQGPADDLGVLGAELHDKNLRASHGPSSS